MYAPVDITFRDMTPSPCVEDAVNRWAARLEHTYDQIERCSVVIEVPHHHHRKGNTFRVRVEVTLPNRKIEVSRDPGINHAHEDVYVAISTAFRAARRQLLDHARITRGGVKLHA